MPSFGGVLFLINFGLGSPHRLGKAANRFFPAAARRTVGNDRDLLDAGFLDPFDLRAALGGRTDD
jgi:hypothetical protein